MRLQGMALGLVLVASITLAGCTGPGQGSQGTIDITLELDQDRLRPGEYVNVTLTFEHGGGEPYTYTHPGCPPEPFDVNAQVNGDEVRLYPYGEEPAFGACATREVTLQPGDNQTVIYMWNAHTEPAQPDPHTGERVSPGQYTITGELSRADDGPTFAESATITVVS